MKKRILHVFGIAMLLLSGTTFARGCDLSVETGDGFTWPSSLSVPSTCSTVTLNLSHSGKMPKNVMGHNWVLSRTADKNAVAMDGMKVASASGYTTAVKDNDDRVIAHTVLIGGGESTSITFSLEGLSASESYTFFCSFPGHSSLMKGEFKII
ncbi:MAG: azurin [Candidatus Azotimanducaceae bacterium]